MTNLMVLWHVFGVFDVFDMLYVFYFFYVFLFKCPKNQNVNNPNAPQQLKYLLYNSHIFNVVCFVFLCVVSCMFETIHFSYHIYHHYMYGYMAINGVLGLMKVRVSKGLEGLMEHCKMLKTNLNHILKRDHISFKTTHFTLSKSSFHAYMKFIIFSPQTNISAQTF